MGKKSVKENKSVYQLAREEAGLSRMAAEDVTDEKLAASRIEKIENGMQKARPDEVVNMARAYNKPELCNYFCTNECDIGKIYVPAVETIHDLPQITMEILSNLNALNRFKERIIDITADGRVSDDERADFELFRMQLADMSLSIETLKIWAEKLIEDNKD